MLWSSLKACLLVFHSKEHVRRSAVRFGCSQLPPVQLDSGQAWLDLRLDVMETSMCMQLVATLAYCVRADSKRGNS